MTTEKAGRLASPLTEGLGHNAQAATRDTHRGGHSYEASMLRTLLARIHRDGGHYVEQCGLDRALEDAEAKVVELLALSEHLAVANKRIGQLLDKTAPRTPLTQDAVLDLAEGCTLQFHDLLEFARRVERAHGIEAQR